MIAKSPKGHLIIGTLERLCGCAGINTDTLKRTEDGKADFEYDGYTEIGWNSQFTEEREGERIFLDEKGNECLESEIVWSET
jgi:hypothetical protein